MSSSNVNVKKHSDTLLMMKRNAKARVYVASLSRVLSLKAAAGSEPDSGFSGRPGTGRKQLCRQSAGSTCCKYIPACNSITCQTRKWKLLSQRITSSKSVLCKFPIRSKERAAHEDARSPPSVLHTNMSRSSKCIKSVAMPCFKLRSLVFTSL